jgi:hypothetical protein
MRSTWNDRVVDTAEVTVWARDVFANPECADDWVRNTLVAGVVLRSTWPEFATLAPWAENVIRRSDLAGDRAYNLLAAQLVITEGVLFSPGRPQFEARGPSEPEKAGDIGGDYQTGEAYSRRFAARLDAEHWAVVTVQYYIGLASYSDETPTLWRQDEYILCTDPDHPCDSEVRSDQRDYEVPDVMPCEDDAFDNCADFPPDAVLWLDSVSDGLIKHEAV